MAKRDYVTCILMALCLLSCGRKKGGEGADDDKLKVCVSIEPQRYFVEKIGGDRVRVMSFMPSDADPENFDPPVSAMRGAADSDLYLPISYLPWEERIISRLRQGNPGLKVGEMSAGITPIYGTHGHEGESEEEFDPHVWSGVRNAKIMTDNVLAALAASDSGNVAFYRANHAMLRSRLDSIDSVFTARLAPHCGASFLVWHPSLSYFARDYGLNQIALGEENKELSLPGMREKVQQIGESTARVFFLQPQMDGGKSETILKLSNLTPVSINLLSEDWEGEMNKIVDALTQQNGRPQDN